MPLLARRAASATERTLVYFRMTMYMRPPCVSVRAPRIKAYRGAAGLGPTSEMVEWIPLEAALALTADAIVRLARPQASRFAFICLLPCSAFASGLFAPRRIELMTIMSRTTHEQAAKIDNIKLRRRGMLAPVLIGGAVACGEGPSSRDKY
jgi:hypothetical protein